MLNADAIVDEIAYVLAELFRSELPNGGSHLMLPDEEESCNRRRTFDRRNMTTERRRRGEHAARRRGEHAARSKKTTLTHHMHTEGSGRAGLGALLSDGPREDLWLGPLTVHLWRPLVGTPRVFIYMCGGP